MPHINITHDYVTVSEGVQLRVHKYQADQRMQRGKCPIVLIHGLLNSSEVFDIPGAADLSLARVLSLAGHDVYLFDQRGAGESLVEDWAVGMKESSFEDLPAVISYALKSSHADKVDLGGYSLGGLIIYLYVIGLAKQPMPDKRPRCDQIHRVFAIGTPGALHVRSGKWERMFSRGRELLDSAGPSIEREEFFKHQLLILSPLLSRLISKQMIQWIIRFAGRGKFAACLVKSLPVPNLLFRSSDFDNKTFAKVARSKMLDRSTTQVFAEFFGFEQAGGKISFNSGDLVVKLPEDFEKWPGIPLLLFSSQRDELVLMSEVKEVEKRVKASQLKIIEEEIGVSCGHGGYILHKKIAPFVQQAIVQFLEEE